MKGSTIGHTTARENAKPEYEACEVTIKTVENGVIVTAREQGSEMGEEVTHVFKTLNEALKEVPALISVSKEPKLDVKEKE